MAKFKITGPDGENYEITAPDDASEAQVLAYAKQNYKGAATPEPKPQVAAPTNGFVMGLRDAVDGGAQLLRRAAGDTVGNAIDEAGNWLADKGLPVARSNGVKGVDSIVKGVNTTYDQNRRAGAQTLSGLVTGQQPEPGFDWARLGGNIANPVNYVVPGAAAGVGVKGLALAGAKAGALSGALQPVTGDPEEFWADKAKQTGYGAATGGVMTPVISKAVTGAAKYVQKVLPGGGGATPERITIAVNNTFENQGMPLADVPDVIRESVKRQVAEALKAGQKLNPAEMIRRAEFEAVRLTDEAAPTAGQLSRDPMQFANEKNLSGVRISTPKGEGNSLADRFNLQNQRLGEVFDNMGATNATDRVTAGQTIMNALRDADGPVRAGVDNAYSAARAMTGGRAAEIDRHVFSTTANEALDSGMWGRFVPENIRGLMNDITAGKTPFTVEAAEQVDGILSAAQRKAGKGSPEWSAIGTIRNALRDAPMAAPQKVAPAADQGAAAAANAARTVDEGVTDVASRPVAPGNGLGGQQTLPRPPGTAVAPDFEFQMPPKGSGLGAADVPPVPPIDEGTAAREAFAQARKAARDRFATIEQTPGLAAALDNDAPDHFIKNYVLGANVRDVEAMRTVLENSPEAMAQARAQIADHLKRAAFGANASGDKAFAADRYLGTLHSLGRQKLGVFFSPEEMVQMNLAGKVASDINSIPAGAKYGTNTSGTGAAVMNLLAKLSNSSVMRQLPGARMLANQVGEIQTERAINSALSPVPAQQARELSPEMVRALQRLGPLAAAASGVSAGAAVNQPMDR